ncbi:MAG: hypothetical protein WAV72_22270 [Bradyrhizobium sp.]
MMTRTTIAIAVALQFLAAPVMAQGTSNKDSNAHHYQGGPQTGVPHLTKHLKSSSTTGKAKARTSSGGHHYGGGPKTESHHMGEKK